MTPPEPAWRRYTRFWGARVDADVDDELAFHAEMRARDYRNRGLNDAEANTAALARLGNVRKVRSECLTIGHRRQRRMARAQLVDAFIQDLRYALRTLRRAPGWTTVALLTLALGIGASTTVFSVIDSLILHPLSYVDPDRVALVWQNNAKLGMSMTPSKELVAEFEKSARSLEAIEPYDSHDVVVAGGGAPATMHAAQVRGSFVKFTGIPLLLGRSFAAEELTPGNANVAMISEGMWRERFGGEKDVLGQKIIVDDVPHTIVGVTSKALRLPTLQGNRTDVWLPLVADTNHGSYQTVARIRAGVTMATAAQELESLVAHVPQGPRRDALKQFTIALFRPNQFLSFSSSLYMLAGAVVLLLIVACANVAHLLIARGATREREIAIRTALGAGHGRLLRQSLTESGVIAGLGCALGIAATIGGVKAIVMFRPARVTELGLTQVNATVLWAAVGISAVTGIAFGLTAAFHGLRRTTAGSLRTTTPGGTGAPRTNRLRSVLVVTEMAVSAMLLVGAALLVRSVWKLEHVDPGFDATGLYTLHVDLPPHRYSAATTASFVTQAYDAVHGMTGVKAASLASSTPPNSGYLIGSIEVEGNDYGKKSPGAIAMNEVTPDYFGTVGLRMVAGETFTTGSLERGDVIINEGFARKLWPNESAVGHRIRLGSGPKDAWQNIVGVVSDFPVNGLKSDRTEPLLYLSYNPKERQSLSMAVRVAPGVDPTVALRQVIANADSRLPPASVQTVESALTESFAGQRFTMRLLAAFAGLAVILSGIGLYGVISYVVTQRQREIGIRIALGATPKHIARAIVLKGLLLSSLGLVVGLTAASWGSRVLRSALYGVSRTDPNSYIASAVLLTAVAVLACVVPMRRAMAIDPAIAMRGD